MTVMSTHALEASLDGLRVVRTPVGDRHLAAAMTEHALGLGVEESGHALFADGLPTGCGLLTGLRAISALLRTERPVSEQLAGFVPWPRATARVPVESRTPLSEVDSLVHAVREAEVRLDGGRTLLRYSGTEPVLRILAEGQDAAVVREVVRELERVASEALG